MGKIVRWDMYEMEYRGKDAYSDMPLVPFEEKYIKIYEDLMDSCFYEMRRALNIKPYQKHSCSLEEPAELAKNTYVLLNGGEIICAVTFSQGVIRMWP